ncbi:MAG: hypothetical protein GXX79_07770 [Actinomycetales bacterium]|nr:hypothetical protein [Actinomycetales bacterium]
MALSELVFSSTTEAIGTAVVAVVAFLAGTFRREITIRIRTRATRRFWAPLRARGVCIVLGADPFPPPAAPDPLHAPCSRSTGVLADFEPFGLAGLGEALGLMTLKDHLRTLGIDNLKIVHSASMPPHYFAMNLVLLGGPDCNRITAAALDQENPPARFHELETGRIGLHDATNDVVHEPAFSPVNDRVLVRDVGLVAWIPSPFSEDAVVIVLAGAYGAATYAAAMAVTSSSCTSCMLRSKSRRRLTFLGTSVYGTHVSDPRVLSVVDY